MLSQKIDYVNAETISPLILDPAATAKVLQVSQRTLQRLTSDGAIRSFTIGASRRYSLDAIKEFIRESEAKGVVPCAASI